MGDTTKDKQKGRRRDGKLDGELDRALEETFPASDPVAVGDTTGAEPPKIVSEVMTTDVEDVSCFEDDRLDEVIRRMRKMQIGCMPVIDRDKRLVGMVSLADLAEAKLPGAEEALRNISQDSKPERA